MPVITLPDGSQRSFDNPVSVHDVAADIGPGLAKAALAGVVDGSEVDTSHVIEQDARWRLSPSAMMPAWKLFAIPLPTCWPWPPRSCFPGCRSPSAR